MLGVKGLCKNYNKFKAVNNVSFDVNDGEIAVLLGPNGAGKSTSIKAIAGLLKFQGEISICGKDNKSLGAKSKFAYVPEVPALYDLLTVYEHVEYMANAYKVKDYKDKAEHMLK
ncbi:ATP-binding cassette domain-containing protein, partial [Clostridium botulinum]|uniref:ATP-binding cassette domain-containing protein n=1 Tax=Clostridium botulinum TaxID=1491 RepID=UPI001C9A31E2